MDINTRSVMSTLAIVPLALLASTWGVQKLQTMLIYPSNVPEGSRTHVDTPDMFNIPYENVTIQTSDGEKLQAYIMLQNKNDPEYTNKTVLMLAPNAGNIGHTLPIAELLYKKMKYNVVTFSYRGYGLSTGTPSEAGIKLDAQCVLRYLSDHSQIKSSSIVLYGRSLGGAVAIYITTLPQASGFVKGVILENTFLSIPKLIPNVAPIFRPLTFLVNQVWSSETTILNMPTNLPVLFLSGAQDELVPPAHLKELYDLTPCKTKILKSLAHGMHNNTVLQEHYWEYVYEFILTLVEPVEGTSSDAKASQDQNGEVEEEEELNEDDMEVLLHMAQAEHERSKALGLDEKI